MKSKRAVENAVLATPLVLFLLAMLGFPVVLERVAFS